MYLKDSEECEVLLRLIDDCDQLVAKQMLDGAAAYRMISEASKHHSDHPGQKRIRLAEIDAEIKARKAETPEPVPVPEQL